MSKKSLFLLLFVLSLGVNDISAQRRFLKHEQKEISRAEIANLLSQERSDLRSEMVGMQGAQYQIVLGLLTASGALIALIFGKDIFNNQNVHTMIVFALTQVIFILSLFNFTMMKNLGVHAEYIQAIERKINSLANDSISLWESEISPRFLYSPKSSAFWLGSLFGIVGIVLFVSLIFYLRKNISWKRTRRPIIFLLLSQIAILLVMFLFMQIETGAASRYANRRFNLSHTLDVAKSP